MDVSRLFAASALAFALMAASASASDVDVSGGTLRYVPGLGEDNVLTISRTGDTWHLDDPGSDSIAPGPGCVATGLFSADCTGPGLQAIQVGLGDHNDLVQIVDSPPGATVLDGGDGADVLLGGPGNDDLIGGPGADVLSGGGGFDTADYRARTAPLGVTVDDRPGDGEAGEGDDVRTDVEAVAGGAGPDVLVGSLGANDLQGGPGDDVLDGGAGPDVLTGGPGHDVVTYAGRTSGVGVSLDGAADDGAPGEGDAVDSEDVLGGAGDDTLVGDNGANALDGGPGDDVIAGAGGSDRLSGGPGSDYVDARDGTPDQVDCGGGLDFTAADPADVPVACERSDRIVGTEQPTVRRDALVREVSGTVTIRFPGTRPFVPLDGALRVPLGSEIDATAGVVRLTTARDSRGHTQAGTFYEGRFIVRQGGGREPVTELRLSGGDFSSCRFAADGKPRRHLWGRERRGKFRTRGRWSSGAVRGTTWLTRDTCAGTLTR
jgi:Ca2+-binding RTX toxin-like protein